MNRKIRTYEDLLNHQADLQDKVREKKLLIYEDFKMIDGHISPLFSLAGKIFSLFNPKGNPSLLIKGGAAAMSILVGSMIIKKSGWLGRQMINVLYRLTHRVRYEKVI
ncbi:MAG: hypothetical protein ACHQET_06465 [Chitinophagales bacterium]